MKITLEHYGLRISVSCKRDDIRIQEALGLCACALEGAGYHPALLDEHLPTSVLPGFDTDRFGNNFNDDIEVEVE